jgi:hypothetical protein
MATYQEQLDKTRSSKVTRAMVAMAELAQISDAMVLLERDGIVDTEGRIAFCKAFFLAHPEINEAIAASGVAP